MLHPRRVLQEQDAIFYFRHESIGNAVTFGEPPPDNRPAARSAGEFGLGDGAYEAFDDEADLKNCDVETAPNTKSRARERGIAPGEPPTVRSSAQFAAEYVPPDYLVVGILQRRFAYSLTAGTGNGKTALALLLAASVGLGRRFGSCDVEQGRVLFLAGEHPDDVRPRWIAMAQQMGFTLDAIQVYFVPGVFKISEMRARIEEQVKAIGDLSLIVVDSSAAFFEGDDENSNVQQGVHARRFRSLVTLPGGPCVLVLCHPTKNANGTTGTNLLPRGGGAFVAELDGNLSATRSEGIVTLHWQGKFRGPDFAPVSFDLRTVTNERLRDSKGRLIPTVVAVAHSDTARSESVAAAHSDEILVLRQILNTPKASQAEMARALRWFLKNGDPYKTRVARAQKCLLGSTLAIVEGGAWVVTPKGERTLADLNYCRDAA